MEQFYLCSSEILGLSKSTVKVYSFLRMVSNQVTNASFYKKRNIAAQCHVSESTVVRAIRELCEKGLLEIRKRFLSNRQQTSNLYILLDTQQLNSGSTASNEGTKGTQPLVYTKTTKEPVAESQPKMRLFKCKSSIFQTNLKPNEVKIYSYLSFRAGKDGQCLPCKKDIAADCRISVSTVSRAVRKLCNAGLLEVRSQTRIETCGNNGTSVNLYILKENTPSTPTNDPNASKPVSEKTGLKNVLISVLLHLLTPSPMSPVTPQRTMSRKKVTLKQRKEDLSSKLAKRILLHKHKFRAWREILLAKADDG